MGSLHLIRAGLRVFSILLLLIILLATFARRDFSGAWIAFESGYIASQGVFLMTGDGGSVRRLSPDHMCGTHPRWSADGKWIAFFDRCDTLPEESRIRPGDSFPQPITSDFVGAPPYFIPPYGQPVLIAENTGSSQEFLVARESGQVLLSLPDLFDPQWSADGEWMAFLGGEPANVHIYRIRSDGSKLEQLTRRASNILDLKWSPDSDWLLFTRANQRYADIYRIRADGSSMQHLATGLAPQYAPFPDSAWHPFGVTLAALGIIALSLIGRSPG